MAKRTLVVTIDANWQEAMRNTARMAFASTFYQGETLNFETPGAFFGKLTEQRWNLLKILQTTGELTLHELARRSEYAVQNTHEDLTVLAELGLVEFKDNDMVICPYVDIHVDMHLRQAA